MIRRLYDWTMGLAHHPYAAYWLAFISFIESSVFPIPPDVILVPMAVARREKAFYFAGICTVFSILGAVLGYAIGYFLWETIGQPIFEFYGYMDEFQKFQEGFNEWGGWLVFVFGITFFPFKVITIASGVTGLDFTTFLFAGVAARTPRFFIEAALLWKFGAQIQSFIEKRLTLITTMVVILGISGFVLIKYI